MWLGGRIEWVHRGVRVLSWLCAHACVGVGVLACVFVSVWMHGCACIGGCMRACVACMVLFSGVWHMCVRVHGLLVWHGVSACMAFMVWHSMYFIYIFFWVGGACGVGCSGGMWEVWGVRGLA